MEGICLWKDCDVRSDTSACEEAIWWTKKYGKDAPLVVPVLAIREGIPPTCEDCVMFQPTR